MKDYICDVCGNRLSGNHRIESETFPSISSYSRSIDIMKLYTRRDSTSRSYDSCKNLEQCVKSIDLCSQCMQAVMDALDKRNPNVKPPATEPENPDDGNTTMPEEPEKPTEPETPVDPPKEPSGTETPPDPGVDEGDEDTETDENS